MPAVERKLAASSGVCASTGVILGLGIAAWVGISGAPSALAASPHVVTVIARDYYYEAPETIQAGLTTFRLVNAGGDIHHMHIERLDHDVSLEDFVAALPIEGGGHPGVESFGGPGAIGPGAEERFTVLLEPGRYVLVCVLQTERMRHYAAGMFRLFTVVPSDQGAAASPPAVDVVLTLVDHEFRLSKPLVAGPQTVRVENRGSQVHHAVVSRLAPGKTLEDVKGFLRSPEGASPHRRVGGTTAIAPGRTAWIGLDLEPGRYALICRILEAKDRRHHFEHGMILELRIP